MYTFWHTTSHKIFVCLVLYLTFWSRVRSYYSDAVTTFRSLFLAQKCFLNLTNVHVSKMCSISLAIGICFFPEKKCNSTNGPRHKHATTSLPSCNILLQCGPLFSRIPDFVSQSTPFLCVFPPQKSATFCCRAEGEIKWYCTAVALRLDYSVISFVFFNSSSLLIVVTCLRGKAVRSSDNFAK